MTAGAVRTGVSRLRRDGWELPYAPRAREQASAAELESRLAAARDAAAQNVRGAARRIAILELRIKGLTVEEIAQKLGVSAPVVSKATKDPEHIRSQSTRHRFRGRCTGCGAPTTYTSRYDASAPNRHRSEGTLAQHCDRCAREARWGHEAWTKESIIRELQAMARRLDRTPKISDLSAPGAPFGPTTIYRVFGKRGWRKALTAAGLVARNVGGQTREDETETEVTWEQRATVLRLGGALEFDGEGVELIAGSPQGESSPHGKKPRSARRSLAHEGR
jgi:transposase